MKNKIIYGLAFLSLVSVSCTKDFDDMNVNKKKPTEAPPQALFANAAQTLNRQVVTLNVNENNLKLWSQYITETTYTDEANYLNNRNIPQREWRQMYREVLKDLDEAKSFTLAESWVTPEDIAAQKNRLAIMEIYNVYAYERLVSIFGNVPYTDALTETNLPAFDDAKTIYADLDKRLTAAIGDLDAANGSFDGGYDNLFGGDVSMWEKFAYGMKLKMAMTYADVDAVKAQALFNEASTKVMAAGESASFGFMNTAPNTNPMWEDLVNSGRSDFVAANTIVDTMNSMADPRLGKYFTFAPGTTTYVGGTYGKGSSFGKHSHLAPYFSDPTQPTVLMDGVEMAFYLAEAAARGWGGDAATLYAAAIQASMDSWGVSSADATTYIGSATVDFATAGGTDLDKIGTQAWLAFFNRGNLGWTTYRRLDMAGKNGVNGDDLMNQAAGTTELTPKRYTYPINEQTLNGTNYQAAKSAIGGDDLSTKLWWDMN